MSESGGSATTTSNKGLTLTQRRLQRFMEHKRASSLRHEKRTPLSPRGGGALSPNTNCSHHNHNNNTVAKDEAVRHSAMDTVLYSNKRATRPVVGGQQAEEATGQASRPAASTTGSSNNNDSSFERSERLHKLLRQAARKRQGSPDKMDERYQQAVQIVQRRLLQQQQQDRRSPSQPQNNNDDDKSPSTSAEMMASSTAPLSGPSNNNNGNTPSQDDHGVCTAVEVPPCNDPMVPASPPEVRPVWTDHDSTTTTASVTVDNHEGDASRQDKNDNNAVRDTTPLGSDACVVDVQSPEDTIPPTTRAPAASRQSSLGQNTTAVQMVSDTIVAPGRSDSVDGDETNAALIAKPKCFHHPVYSTSGRGDLFADEKKEDHDAKTRSTSSQTTNTEDLLRTLYPYFCGEERPTATELTGFGQFVAFARPLLVQGRAPSAQQVSQILSHAKDWGISLDVADQVVEICEVIDWEGIGVAINNSNDKPEQQQSGTDDDADLFSFLSNLVAYFGQDEAEESQAETSDIGMEPFFVDANKRVADDCGVEVDLYDGFVRNQDTPSSKEEPWWEIAARLEASPSKREEWETTSNDCFASDQLLFDDDSVHASPMANNTSLDEEIDQFWQTQRQLHEAESTEPCKKLKMNTHKARVRFSKRMTRAQRPSTAYLETQIEQERHLTKWAKHTTRDTRRSWISRLLVLERTECRPLNAVEIASRRIENSFENHTRNKHLFANRWRQAYAERVQEHNGFFFIDKYSLGDSSRLDKQPGAIDDTHWEKRAVKQRFLAEQSVDGRNWFGCLHEKKGNRVVKQPVCRPLSMEMPVRAAEWTEEWVGQTRIDHIHANLGHEYDAYLSQDEWDDDQSWEDVPECGKLRNVKLMPGTPLTRLTPDLTSSLRRSRWRKKYAR